jgi:hypothetical protein
VRYLATLIDSTDEATKRWFILAVALLLDPAAVLLLLAAAYTGPPDSPTLSRPTFEAPGSIRPQRRGAP